jgi:hypothetical protein
MFETKDLKALQATLTALHKECVALGQDPTSAPLDHESLWLQWVAASSQCAALQSYFGQGTLSRPGQKAACNATVSLAKAIKFELMDAGGKNQLGFAALPTYFSALKPAYLGAVLTPASAAHFFDCNATLCVLGTTKAGLFFQATSRVGPCADFKPEGLTDSWNVIWHLACTATQKEVSA